jgi:hypothetical protein
MGDLVPKDGTRWAGLARDCVYMCLPQSKKELTLPKILEDYGLTESEFALIMADPDFEELLRAEGARAKAMGPHAGFIFRVEAMTSDLAEHLHSRLTDPDDPAPLAELIRGYATLAKSAGLDELPERAKTVGTQVAVQVNIPQLTNPKLDHLRVK